MLDLLELVRDLIRTRDNMSVKQLSDVIATERVIAREAYHILLSRPRFVTTDTR